MKHDSSIGGGLLVLAAAIFWSSGCHSEWVVIMAVIGTAALF